MKIRLLLALLLVVLTCEGAFANFLDDFVNSAVSSGPSSHKGQARGWASGGSYSLHTPTRSDVLISAQAPKFSVGCGGLDFNMGSLSWLSPEQLVKKGQRILKSSGFLLFDMALDTICPKCSALMKAAENIAQKLNEMSINDCQMAKGLTMAAKDGLSALTSSGSEDAMKNGFSQSWSDIKGALPKFDISMNDVTSWYSGSKGDPNATAKGSGPFDGCPGLFGQYLASGKSLNQFIGEQLGIPSAYTGFLGSLVGDLIIDPTSDTKSKFVMRCSISGTANLDDMINGNGIQSLDPKTGVCTNVQLTDSPLRINEAILLRLAEAIRTGQAASNADIVFATTAPVGVINLLKAAIVTGQEDVMIPLMNEFITKMIMANVLRVATQDMMQIIRNANNSIEKGVVKTSTCDLTVIDPKELKANLSALSDNARDIAQQIQPQLQSASTIFRDQVSLMETLQNIDRMLKDQASKQFGIAVASRISRIGD